MSAHLVLLAGKTVYGPGVPNDDQPMLDSQRITLPGDVTAEVLFVKHGDKNDVRNYLLASLYEANKETRRKYPVKRDSYYCTLASTPKHRHNICLDSKIVRSIFHIYREDILRIPRSGVRSSIHSFHLINFGATRLNLQAVVFFRGDVFCVEPESTDTCGLPGEKMATAIGLDTMNAFKFAPHINDDSFYFLSVQKNTHSTCWCIQVMYSFHALLGKQLSSVMYRISNFSSDEVERYSSMVSELPESVVDKVYELHDLFSCIYTWMAFCCKLKEVTFVCMDYVRNLIVTCPLIKLTKDPTAQEDSQEVVRRLFDLFIEYYTFLKRVEADEFSRFLDQPNVNPTVHCRFQASISYKCSECGREARDEQCTLKGGFKINPNTTTIYSERDFSMAVNSLFSTYCNQFCSNQLCRHSLTRTEIHSVEVLRCEKSSKFLVCCQLNNDDRHADRREWCIPTEEFFVGRNKAKVEYVVMNHATGNFGTSGHYTGALVINGGFFYLLDDGAHPIPIKDLSNVSKYAAFLVCSVTDQINDEEYATFRAEVEDIQRRECVEELLNKITSTIGGIFENLIPIAVGAVEEWEKDKTELLKQSACAYVFELSTRIKQAEEYIFEYKRIVPVDSHANEVEAGAISLDNPKRLVDDLRIRLGMT